MNILIIGGTGFISSRLVEKLLQSGNKVIVYTRGKSKKKIRGNPNLIYETGNRENEKRLSELLSKHKFDVVYDMIAYLPEESELMVKIFKGKIVRFIHCSTISVYMVSDDIQCPVTEDQDKRKLMEYYPRNPFGMDYGINKRKCENVLWNAHNDKNFPVTCLRPTFVSGPEDPSKRDYFWIERIKDGKPLLVPGTGEFRFQQVFVKDAAKAFCDLLDYDVTIGESSNVAAEEIFTLNEYLKAIGELMDNSSKLVHIEQNIFDKLEISYYPGTDVFPFNTRRDAFFSLEKIKKHINYKTTPFKEWMEKTISWYLNEFDGHSVAYNKREEEIKILESFRN
ncbi:MAG: NAD-dependent epimerase/dehydratase family protein [Ignavibacteria bacterium]|nr:NAD-dependent epimerase/dehydratase family protein [Ignavibacteria bacterium]